MGIKLTDDEIREAANSVPLKPYTRDELEYAKRNAIANAATAQAVEEIGKQLYHDGVINRYTISIRRWDAIREAVGLEPPPE